MANYNPESICSDLDPLQAKVKTSNLYWEIGHLSVIMYIIFIHSLYIGFSITLHPVLITLELLTLVESINFLIVNLRKY